MTTTADHAHAPNPPPAPPPIPRPEVLAPAGTWQSMRAAVENGADAVYFGVEDFNARLRAENFTQGDLPKIFEWLHERGVRGYLTLNTLIFASEMPQALTLLRAANAAGADAVLVQDLGLALLAARMVPNLPIHASTQMTLTCAESVREASALGLNLARVVAPRELSIRELAAFRRTCDIPIEVFVHGALCVAYSGQCLTSEALGGRSANRGECAQACRLPYDLVVDGDTRPLGDVKYLLSPKDLAAFEDVGALAELGIVGIKIEGRLKSPAYVAAAVQAYRNALDQVFAAFAPPQGPSAPLSANPSSSADATGVPPASLLRTPVLDPATRYKLEQTFSRGFTPGYVHSIDHQAVVEGRYPKKRGIYLGRVTAVSQRGIAVRLEGPLRPGDGIVFDAGHPEGDEEGGRVYEMWRGRQRLEEFTPPSVFAAAAAALSALDRPRHAPSAQAPSPARDTASPDEILLTFQHGKLNPQRIHPGDRVWKTSDPRLESELDATWQGDEIRHRRPISLLASARPGEPLRLRLDDGQGCAVEVADTEPAQAALKRPLTSEVLAAQLGRLGGTPFELGHIEVQLEGPVMVPFSRLNELRRRGVEALLQRRRERPRENRPLHPGVLEAFRARTPRETPTPSDAPTSSTPRLSVLCRTLPQVEAAAQSPGVHTIYTDFEDIRLHREARRILPHGAGPRLAPATLRIIKPPEAPFVRKILEAEPDAVLVRGLAALHILRQARPELELIGDYSLNVANDVTAAMLWQRGLHRLTPAYDLNIDQLLDLLRHAPPHRFEITIHQHMPLFHMEHCVFCRFLSNGTDHTNCGRPCDTHRITLRDRLGYEHPVKADAGCRNTVFNATAQSASEYVATLRAAGVLNYRIELLDEDPDATRQRIAAYLPVVQGQRDGHDLWQQMRAVSRLGVTRGSLDHGRTGEP